MTDLSTVSTRELCDELAKRDGVREHQIRKGDVYNLKIARPDENGFFAPNWHDNRGNGAARILVVTG